MIEYLHSEETPAENIPDLIIAHENAIRRLKDLLPIACERDGHQWSVPFRENLCTNSGMWHKNDEHDGKWTTASGWWEVEPTYEDVFSRTCSVCGKKESKPTKFNVVNPFGAVSI